MQDEQIVELYWQRDEKAIPATQEKYEPYLMKIAVNILANREDGEESVNDTYLAAWNSMPPQKPSVLSAYLGKLARRISISLYRKKNSIKRQGSEYALSLSDLDEITSRKDSPEAEMEAALLGEIIDRFLRTLPEMERNTFIGRYYYMDPLKEVAAYCGLSEAGAKSMLYRTRQKLKEALAKEGFIV
ncbi:MAG: sigma-70 family RNA polymerase sigma factor [Clostridia bacterium]|nr:sigma-70 family RNA polymerase sigma factor [Clostridia bacterium]